jgi:S-adenosylmethionine:tRNA ribosyltransferase-isomerase
MRMRLEDFDYQLPQEYIAQEPAEPRDSSKLLVLERKSGRLFHRVFCDIAEILRPTDVLVLNDTRVIPARLFGRRKDTGGSMEVLLLTRQTPDIWEVLTRPGRRAKSGKRFVFGNGELEAEVIDITASGNRIMRFSFDGSFEDVLERLGKIPLPPYIKTELRDTGKYQTVYSRESGSVAAPTAGLHFTSRLLESLDKMGVQTVYVTLHVGLGTFRPVSEETIEDHKMHREYYKVGTRAAECVNAAKDEGRRIIAVGTTSVRILETVAEASGRIAPAEGWTDIFIYPGYEFRCVDGLITNFHLPKSTLLMLVSAFAGRENIMNAYKTAVTRGYTFFSFGDAMLIL